MRWADVYVPHVSPASMSPASMRRCPRALSPRLGQRAQSVEQDGSLVRERHGGQGTWSERATSRRLGRLLSRRGCCAVVAHARLHWSWANPDPKIAWASNNNCNASDGLPREPKERTYP